MKSLITAEGFEKTFRYLKLFRQGLIVTVMLAAFTVLIGFICGILLATMRMSDFRPFRFLGLDKNGHLRSKGILLTISKFNPLSFFATCYVELIRSTPILVQIMIIYYGVFGLLFKLPNYTFLGFIKFNLLRFSYEKIKARRHS